MKRYKEFSSIVKDPQTKKERVSSTFYPEFPYRDSDVYIFTRRSDRLDLLAYQYYGDSSYWWVIARVNNVGKGTFSLPPGLRIRIPYPVTELDLRQLKDNNGQF